MQYLGSKNKIAKYIIPFIEYYIEKINANTYLEPFVGGANLIDKVNFSNKIGCDINKYVISLLQHAQITTKDFPKSISNEEYVKVKSNINDYPDWYVSLVGFCASFACKWWGGYARDRQTNRDIPSKAICNIVKQAPNLKDILFIERDYLDTPKSIKNCVIYCDPPYNKTTSYKTINNGRCKNKGFDYEQLYNWCIEMSKHNIVLLSEYNILDKYINNFELLWEKDVVVNFSSNRGNDKEKKIRVEKLFICKGEKYYETI